MIKINMRAAVTVQIAAALFFSPTTLNMPVEAQATDAVTVSSENGLTTTIFKLRGGTVKVYLPEDIAAGDTISGTVIAEPKTLAADERTRGSDTLEGVVLDLGDKQPISVCNPCATLKTFVLPHVLEQTRSMKRLSVVQPGRPPVVASIPVSPTPFAPVTDANIPPLSQTGRPLPIGGAFDGNAANTACSIGGQSATFLSESPRTAIFRTPNDLSGLADVRVTERGGAIEGSTRVLQVRLSAAKTALTRGERTNVHLEIRGLQGESRTVPLRVVTTGAATMQGGNTQMISIGPGDIGTDGTFRHDFSLTGTMTGTFSVTCSVPIANPAGKGDAGCACFCEINKNPIVTAGKQQVGGGARHSFTPNISKVACNGNQCSIAKTEYSWSVGAGSTATYTILGGIDDAETISLDVTKAGTIELTVTVTVKCSDGTSCTDTGTKTFKVDSK